LTANTPVNPTANGYAIESNPTGITPTVGGTAFNAGILKMTSSGYAYSQIPSADLFALLSALPSSSKKSNSESTNISVTSGKHYLIAACAIYTSSTVAITISGCNVAWEMPLVNSAGSNSRYSLMKVALVTATASNIQVTFGSATAGRGYIALQLD
jgi:hypothetical protein